MNYNLDLQYNKLGGTNGELLFKLNGKEYNFKLDVYTPDCEPYNNVNAYYFTCEKINEYGAKLCYVEYVNCFETFVNNKTKNKLFDIQFKKEENKKFFLEINDFIIKKVKKHFRIEEQKLDINEFKDSDDNEIKKETYYIDDTMMNCEGWYLNYKLCPTLKELFDKYGYDINKISNICIEFQKLIKPLEGDLSKYSIDFRGDGMGIIIIDYSNFDETNDYDSFVQDIQITSLSDLLQLPVFIPTWNKYRWREQEYTEEEIVKLIWLKLL